MSASAPSPAPIDPHDRPLFTGARHHEFWPSWLFYAPLMPYLMLLALRHRTLTGFTAVNPGVGGGGGTIGESKLAVTASLANVPITEVTPGVRAVEPADIQSPIAATYLVSSDRSPADRTHALARLLDARADRLSFPFILKPDAGQRGYAVKLCRSLADAERYFSSYTRDAVVQAYHPGPFEIGVFWVRHASTVAIDTPPERPAGFIFAITLKHFQFLEGDGTRTIAQLIRNHPRLHAQESVLRTRFADQLHRVLPAGEQLRAAIAGNHAQGTLFTDGAHLITPALSSAIDRIARRFGDPTGRRGSFDFGRFDLRFRDAADLLNGTLDPGSIIELNAAMSEATNIYDPSRSFRWAQRTLRAQWSHLMTLASARRRAGHRAMSPREVISALRAFYTDRPGSAISD
ncbi:MAG: hypothetical protein K2W85_17075 [Phycisphaerales bacterium]|nr:hypothetical protein [Phycisphaerales bacterium]